MSEVITIGTGSETILGTYDGAVAYVETMLGTRYDTWIAANETTRKKSLVSAVRFLNAQVWSEDADTFAERDAIDAFHNAQYELAVMIVEDSTVTDAADQGSNIQSMGAGSAQITFFNPTTKNADPLPPILMRLVGPYLSVSMTGLLDGGASQGGSCVNPFSSCKDLDREEPY